MTIPSYGKCCCCRQRKFVVYVKRSGKLCCCACWDGYIYRLNSGEDVNANPSAYRFAKPTR